MKSAGILLLTLFALLNAGCANFGKDLKAFLKGTPSQPVGVAASTQAPRVSDDVVRYSEVKNMPYEDEREYRRMSRKEFEDQELRSDNTGSLWIMEGQDSYLFTENNVRLPGDLINVALEGQPEKHLSTKAKVIKDLMKKIEAKRKMASTKPAATGEAKPETGAEAAKPAAAPADGAKPDAQKTAEAPADEEMDLGGDFDVKAVPSRIVEKLSDGNYRIKGSQNFMIGAKEYKVIVTGLVKPSDVNNNMVDSSKILDSKFDIVRSAKR